MKEIRILGIRVGDRTAEAGEVQKILTKYGCSIKTRLGLHEADEVKCGTGGLILLELGGDTAGWDNLEKELKKLSGITVGKMIL